MQGRSPKTELWVVSSEMFSDAPCLDSNLWFHFYRHCTIMYYSKAAKMLKGMNR